MSALEPRDAAAVPLPKQLGQAVARRAVEHALGEQLSPEAQKALAAQLEPWAERLAYYLDDWIRIPGTNVRFGLDALVGLVPGVGDLVTGTGSVALLLLALRRGVPTVGIARMVLNIAIDTLGGALPVVGDAFDAVWRSNRKNLEILQRYAEDPHAEPSAGDKLLVGAGIALAILSVLVPLLVGAWLGVGLATLFG